MKNVLQQIIIGASLLLAPFYGYAEMLTGKVLSVNRDKQQMVILTQDENKKDQKIVIQADTPLPPCIQVDLSIRAWGEYTADTHQFSATDIRGPGNKYGKDKTGVRSRLHRHKTRPRNKAGHQQRRHRRMNRHRR